jgi:hypothetical protein
MDEHIYVPSFILRYFDWKHLPSHLKFVAQRYEEIARQMDYILPPGAEKSVALRKLLESKDAAVRAALDIKKEK